MTNRNRKFVLLSISLIGLVLLLCSTATFANPDFSGGDGTAESPWQISNADELDALRNYLGSGHADKHFVLTADIDLWGFGGEEGWQSIGTFGSPGGFGGTFDGNGFVIRNLTINRPARFYQGLFGATTNATIRNLGLESVQIIGNRWTGGLVGRATGGLIDSVSVSGRIEGGIEVGGLVGQIEASSTIHRSRAQVEVFGNDRVGGLVGLASGSASSSGLVAQSYSLGQVTSSGGEVGGLIGRLSGLSVTDSYSHASASGEVAGGLIGQIVFSHTTVQRCYASGLVSGDGDDVGGFLGQLGGTASPTFSDNYWDTQTSGQTTSAGGAGISGRTTAQMQQQSTFDQWNFSDIWSINEGVSYPWLQNAGRLLSIRPMVRGHGNEASSGHELEILGNAIWSASTDVGWLTISSGQSGSGAGELLYSVAENVTGQARTGTIVITDPSGPQSTMTVYQGVTTPFLERTPGFGEHSAAASSGHQIEVQSNVSWTAVPDVAWVNITSGSSGSGDGVIVYSIDANDDNRARYGAIIVTDGARMLDTRISQAAARTISGVATGLTEPITIQNNGEDDLEILEDGGFTFMTLIADGAEYEVTVTQSPEDRQCRAVNGSGVVSGTNVHDIQVICSPDELFMDRFED